MSFVRFTEPNAVTFDKSGNPNSFGRVTFCAIGTTTKKDIWNDSDLTIGIENPLYFDAGGRLEKDVYLEVGDYTVYYEKYEGTGNSKTAPDSDFSTIYDADVAGKEAPASTNGSKIQVNTIAELRLIETPSEPVDVLSYNAVGDCFSRTYYWDPTSTEDDNYGSIIKATSQFTGRYKTKFSNVIDVRTFGIFPGSDSTKNSQLNALISFVNSSTEVHTIYFPTGTYYFVAGTFTFATKVILDKDVKFAIDGARTLNIYFNGDYDIQTLNPLVRNKAALTYVKIYFNSGIVKSCWYGIGGDYVNGDIDILTAISQRALTTVDINGLYYAKGLSIPTFLYDVNFVTGGQIVIDAGRIIFSGCKVRNINASYPLLRNAGGSWSSLWLTNNADITSNAFKNCNDTMDVVLTGIQTYSTTSFFTFDSDVVFVGAYTDSGELHFKHSKGTITSLTNFATFKTFDCDDTGPIFSNNVLVAILNKPVKASWFRKYTDVDNSIGFADALRCACKGSGLLDLCNLTFEINSGSTISNINTALPSMEVYNGFINIRTASIDFMKFTVDIPKITFKNITGNGFGFDSYTNFIKLDGNHGYRGLTIDRCSFEWLNLVTSLQGTILDYRLINSKVGTGCSVYIGKPLYKVLVKDNEYINGSTQLEAQTLIMSNNNFEIVGSCNIKARESIISNNRFNLTDLYVEDDSGSIKTNINNNIFQSTDSKWSRIMFNTYTANTKFKGTSVCGNSFTGSVSADLITIGTTGTFSTSAQDIVIANNSSDRTNKLFVPQTVGDSRNLVNTFQGASSTTRFYYYKNLKYIFFIPGCAIPPSVLHVLSLGGQYSLGDVSVLDGVNYYVEMTFANTAGGSADVLTEGHWSIYSY